MNLDKRIALDRTKVALSDEGRACDPNILSLAVKKAERWMRNAYGCLDWDNYLAECTDLQVWYDECEKAPNSPGTFNRQNQRRVKK